MILITSWIVGLVLVGWLRRRSGRPFLSHLRGDVAAGLACGTFLWAVVRVVLI